jgi:hypothetical protein
LNDGNLTPSRWDYSLWGGEINRAFKMGEEITPLSNLSHKGREEKAGRLRGVKPLFHLNPFP